MGNATVVAALAVLGLGALGAAPLGCGGSGAAPPSDSRLAIAPGASATAPGASSGAPSSPACACSPCASSEGRAPSPNGPAASEEAALAPAPAPGAPPRGPRGRPPIRVETRGRLVFRDTRYRVVVRPNAGTDDVKKELVVDLRISENKVLVRRLDALRDKDVVVTGPLVWVPKGSSVTSDADYTLGLEDFEIDEAPRK